MSLSKDVLFSNMPSHIISTSVWIGSVVIILFISPIVLFFSKLFASKDKTTRSVVSWSEYTVKIIKRPLLALVILYGIYILGNFLQVYMPSVVTDEVIIFERWIMRIGEFIIFFWLLLNALEVSKAALLNWAKIHSNKVVYILIPYFHNSLKAIAFLLMVNIIVPELHVSGLTGLAIDKFSKIFLIAIMGWLFCQIVNVLEEIIRNQYVFNTETDLTGRKINTQLLILKRIVLTIGVVVTIAAILMVFDSVKNLGTGLLTTAGIISAVGAFASQQSLSRIFAGLQIAFTQPIRIADTVIIDNEFGQVEEITLSYIVVKLWDLRRLILPTDYFTSKGLLNLTRDSTQLLGTVFIYADYTLPIDQVRAKFLELLAASKLWDGKIAALQVTDVKESTVEIRALASAHNAAILFDLRCEMREKLINYIVENFPHCLSQTRNVVKVLPKETEQSDDQLSQLQLKSE